MRKLEYMITEAYDGMSINHFARNVEGMSMHFLRSVKFKENGIKVNGQRVTTRYVLHRGDVLVFTMEDEENGQLVPTEGSVEILWENEDLVLLNKPSGQVVHPCHGHFADTMLNFLSWHYKEKNESWLLRPVGRLDKDTSGLIFVAKNKYASRYMDNQRYAGKIHRFYLALVENWPGKPGYEGIINAAIEKIPEEFNRYRVGEKGRESITKYQVLGLYEQDDQKYALVRLKLETGRTHQIRVHMAHIGCPLLGDPVYGHAGLMGFHRAALHSYRIESCLPKSAERRCFTGPLPEDFLWCPGFSQEAVNLFKIPAIWYDGHNKGV